jgi:mono/diheme cytochrome c family protein
MPIERIEVYLNDSAEPIQVLRQPPFKLKLDTRQLPDGEHLFRVLTYFKGGGLQEQRIPFKVNNLPDVMVQGLDEGAEVHGDLEVALRVGDPDIPVQPQPFPTALLTVAAVLILGGIWGFFALGPSSQKIIEEVAPPPGQTEAHSGGGAVTVDEALLAKGKTVYAAACAGCHGANGEGGFGPALAANQNLKDAQMVLTVITKGRGNMPAQSQLSQEEVSAVTAYIRNSWGNSFGGESKPAGEAPQATDAAALAKEGEGPYTQNCASCHQADGKGLPGVFPALAGNQNIKDKAYHIGIVLKGKNAMPSFARLSDRELAAILTYERVSWGNDFGAISEAEVKAAR